MGGFVIFRVKIGERNEREISYSSCQRHGDKNIVSHVIGNVKCGNNCNNIAKMIKPIIFVEERWAVKIEGQSRKSRESIVQKYRKTYTRVHYDLHDCNNGDGSNNKNENSRDIIREI